MQKKPENEDSGNLGFREIAGIALLAGGAFNIPEILKVPETTADQMMLVIVLAFIAAGCLLLFLPHREGK